VRTEPIALAMRDGAEPAAQHQVQRIAQLALTDHDRAGSAAQLLQLRRDLVHHRLVDAREQRRGAQERDQLVGGYRLCLHAQGPLTNHYRA